MAVALHLPRRVTRTVRGPGARLNLGIHQPLGGEGQHLALEARCRRSSRSAQSVITIDRNLQPALGRRA